MFDENTFDTKKSNEIEETAEPLNNEQNKVVITEHQKSDMNPDLAGHLNQFDQPTERIKEVLENQEKDEELFKSPIHRQPKLTMPTETKRSILFGLFCCCKKPRKERHLDVESLNEGTPFIKNK